ncbi:MAG TPA: toll/interleukin-1 receptor domain-containing protein [Ktedonobacteraceae bacterium]|jgi:hypothetical protein
MHEKHIVTSPLTLFYSYAYEDEALCIELNKHLSSLRQQGLINAWYRHQIMPGTNRSQEIDRYLSEASLILLLVSPDFLASDYCNGVEMQQALQRHHAGEARVIPIILRPVDWQDAPFAHLQYLPASTKSVTEWENRDAGFRNVAQGIRAAVQDMRDASATVEGQSSLSRFPASHIQTQTPFLGPADRGGKLFDKRFLYNVFISYRQQDPDKTWVRRTLVPELEASGLRVCLDDQNFQIGASLLEEIERAIEQSYYTLAILSPAYLQSDFARLENALAQHLGLEKKQRRLLVVMREACTPPLRMRAHLGLDMTDDTEFKTNLARLVYELQMPPDNQIT